MVNYSPVHAVGIAEAKLPGFIDTLHIHRIYVYMMGVELAVPTVFVQILHHLAADCPPMMGLF